MNDDDWTVRRLLDWCAPYLTSKGVERARVDSELLLARCLGVERVWLVAYPDEIVSSILLKEFRDMVFRRAKREPTNRILGEVNFFKETYNINQDVLAPRPETEFLVEGVVQRLKGQQATIADLGTGSGCVLLSSLKSLPECVGWGLDISEKALAVACENAGNLGLEDRSHFAQSNLLDALQSDSLDALVSNPPYLSQVDFDELMPEVSSYDPHLALDGGVDGLEIYRRLFPQVLRVLKPGGVCGVEVGHKQAALVTALGVGAGLTHEETVVDYSQIQRIIWFSHPSL